VAADPQDYDAIVVGSGPIGSAFARTIADARPELRVLILEAGPQTTSPAGRHVKTVTARDVTAEPLSKVTGNSSDAPSNETNRIFARPGTELVGDGIVRPDGSGLPAAAMSTDVGGMGIHWTCACPVPAGRERIPFIPTEDFEEVFADAWRLLNATQSAFLDAPLGAEVRQVLGGAIDHRLPEGRKVQAMPLGIRVDDDGNRYWTGTDVVLGDVVRNGSVELRPDTPVLRVVMDGDRATGVIARIDGEETELRAPIVFVAADSFRTPRLLHVSGVRPRALGHYLNDHPQVLALARLADSFIPTGERPHHERAGIVDPLSGVNWIPYSEAGFPYHGQIMQLDASPVPLSEIAEPWPGSIVGVGLFGCKDLRFEDRVEFDEEDLDELGLPAIKIHYQLTDRDHETLDGMRTEARGLAEALGGLLEGREPAVMPNGSSLHYMGTFRMGETDDGESVCDSTGAVWKTTGLYVGGNGIIPTPTACNPTATSVALAIRSARAVLAGDLLVGRLEGEPSHAS
jgi:choline dehydrogenase-like flavoprotein